MSCSTRDVSAEVRRPPGMQAEGRATGEPEGGGQTGAGDLHTQERAGEQGPGPQGRGYRR